MTVNASEKKGASRLDSLRRSLKQQVLTAFHDAAGVTGKEVMDALYMVAIVSVCPVLTAVFLKQAGLVTVSLFAALFTNMGDSGGLYIARMRTMLLGTCLMIVAEFLAALVGNQAVWFVLSMLVWAFCSGMINVFRRDVSARLSSIAVVGFILLSAHPPDLSSVWLNCLLIAVSACFVIVCRVWRWPFRPDQPVRDAVADYYSRLNSRLIYVLSAENIENDETYRKAGLMRKGVQTVRNLAYLMIRDLQGKFRPATRKMYLLLEKADALFAIQITLAQTRRVSGLNDAGTAARQSMGPILAVLENVLKDIILSIRNGKTTVPDDDLARARRELSRYLADLRKVYADADEPAVKQVVYLVGLFERYMLLLQSMTDIIGETDTALAANARPARQAAASSTPGRLIADNLTWRSGIFRYSVCLAVLLGFAIFIFKFFQVPHGYWLALTIAIILRPDNQLARERAWQRVGGTIAGSIIAIAISVLVHSQAVVFLLIVLLVFLAWLGRGRNYGIYAFFWTPAIVLLLSLPDIGDYSLALIRTANTLAGGLMASMAVFLLLPRWGKRELRDKIVNALAAARHYVQAVLGVYSGKCIATNDLERVRQQANRSCLEAYIALHGTPHRANSGGDSLDWPAQLVSHTQELNNVLTALSLDNPQLEKEDTVRGISFLLQQAGQVLHAVENTVLSGQMPGDLSVFEKGLGAAKNGLIQLEAAHCDQPGRALIETYLSFAIHMQPLAQAVEALHETAALSVAST